MKYCTRMQQPFYVSGAICLFVFVAQTSALQHQSLFHYGPRSGPIKLKKNSHHSAAHNNPMDDLHAAKPSTPNAIDPSVTGAAPDREPHANMRISPPIPEYRIPPFMARHWGGFQTSPVVGAAPIAATAAPYVLSHSKTNVRRQYSSEPYANPVNPTTPISDEDKSAMPVVRSSLDLHEYAPLSAELAFEANPDESGSSTNVPMPMSGAQSASTQGISAAITAETMREGEKAAAASAAAIAVAAAEAGVMAATTRAEEASARMLKLLDELKAAQESAINAASVPGEKSAESPAEFVAADHVENEPESLSNVSSIVTEARVWAEKEVAAAHAEAQIQMNWAYESMEAQIVANANAAKAEEKAASLQSALADQISASEKAAEMYSSTVVALREDVRKTDASLVVARRIEAKLNESIAELSSERNELKAQVMQLRNDLSDSRDALETEVFKLRREIKTARASTLAATTKLSALQKQNEMLKSKINSLKAELIEDSAGRAEAEDAAAKAAADALEAEARAEKEAAKSKTMAIQLKDAVAQVAALKEELALERKKSTRSLTDSSGEIKSLKLEKDIKELNSKLRNKDATNKEALRWFHKAAEEGDAQAQLNLGFVYMNAHGVMQSDKEALRWWSKAAEQGNAMAQNNVGLMFSSGRGVSQNLSEALKWYRMGAAKGFGEAQLNLAKCLHEGNGTDRNMEEAEKWCRLAVKQGNIKAQKYLEGILKKAS